MEETSVSILDIHPISSQIHPISSQNIPRSIHCEFCNISFSTKANMIRHQRKTCKQLVTTPAAKTYITCENCSATYKHPSSFYRHRNLCKKINNASTSKTIDILVKRIEHIEEKHATQISELIKNVGTTNNINTINNINNINNTNNTNNTILLPWNKSSIEHLTDDILRMCALRNRGCIPRLIKEKHFNADVPENMNAYIPDAKNKYAKVFNGDKWVLEDKNRVIQELIDDNKQLIAEKIEEWEEEGDALYHKHAHAFERYIALGNDEYDKDLEDAVKLLLINREGYRKDRLESISITTAQPNPL